MLLHDLQGSQTLIPSREIRTEGRAIVDGCTETVIGEGNGVSARAYYWSGRSRMTKRLLIGACFLALAWAAGAAEIHGTVSEDGKTLAEGVSLKLDCGGTSATAQTDQFGSYSLKVGATGECVVSIDYK